MYTTRRKSVRFVTQAISDDCARNRSTASPLSIRVRRVPSIFVEHIGHVSSVVKYLITIEKKKIIHLSNIIKQYLRNSEWIAGKLHDGHTQKSSRMPSAAWKSTKFHCWPCFGREIFLTVTIQYGNANWQLGHNNS